MFLTALKDLLKNFSFVLGQYENNLYHYFNPLFALFKTMREKTSNRRNSFLSFSLKIADH